MKPAWDQLGDEFKDSPTVVIGDVDCTVEKDLCSKFGVRGYPTIKYFTGSTAAEGDDYKGGRDFAALKEFADENLGPSCSPDNIDLCDADQKAAIEAAQALSDEERAAQIAEKVAAMETAEQTFKDELQKLQDHYSQLQQDKEDAIAAVSPSLRILRSIKSGSKGHDEL
jgi:thioredoxin-like negative regulator of GroEL